MSDPAYRVTELFEAELCRYTSAPFCCVVDNCSNALFLAMKYYIDVQGAPFGNKIILPRRNYMSVPCSVIAAGGKVHWMKDDGKKTLTGEYPLAPTTIMDSALRFTADMFLPGHTHCLSFSGPYKHLKLGKGGAILTDDEDAYKWYKKARFSGRNECSYHEDTFTMLGGNYYILPEISARALVLMKGFYNADGSKKHNMDLTLPYPDLSRFEVYTQNQ